MHQKNFSNLRHCQNTTRSHTNNRYANDDTPNANLRKQRASPAIWDPIWGLPARHQGRYA